MPTKHCFIIPCYQHSATLEKILEELKKFQLKVFVVNDGSDSNHSQVIKSVCSKFDFAELLVHSTNMGKGCAVKSGFRAAYAQGYTHGIQIDSDGQHDLGKVEELLTLSRKFPYDLISGRPLYDQSVPKGRLYGRYVTHIWVWIETLSFKLKDSMCGFRSYPLKSTVKILDKVPVGKGMDFDTEIMVRLYWEGVNTQFIFVPVIYPENGISHFNVWRDNVLISKMHTKLFFGMLLRLPLLLWRKVFSKNLEHKTWYRVEEFGNILGIKTLLLFYKLTGRKILNWILYPVCFYYSLISSNAKKASREYRNLLKRFAQDSTIDFSTLDHIHSFANTAIDKFSVWFGDIGLENLIQEDVDQLLRVADSGKGAFFITSHYGNIEVCRALGRFFPHVKFNALVYYDNAKKFNDYLNKVNAESSLNLISVGNVGPDTSIMLKEKVDNKEWVFIMGDRMSIQGSSRTLSIRLLGENAEISEGPFIMAYLLDVPIYVIHCYRERDKFRIRLKRVEPQVERSRNTRREFMSQVAQEYSSELESLILKDPLQWYNFFDFWSIKDEK